MPRRGLKESDGSCLAAVSKSGQSGIPVKENSGSLGITRSGFLDNGSAENVIATSGNVRAIVERIGTSRSGLSSSLGTGSSVNGGGFGYDRPLYGASGTGSPTKGKAFLASSLIDNATSSRSSSIASSVNENFKVSASSNGRSGARNVGKPIPLGGRGKRVVSGDRRPRNSQGLDLPGGFSSSVAPEDLEATPRETPRTTENTLRSILKHDTNMRSKPGPVVPYKKLLADDNRAILSAVMTKQQEWPYMPCRRQNSQAPSPTSLPPPPFRQSRIPRCTLLNDFRLPRTLPARSKSSEGCCYRRKKYFPLESQYPARREDAGTGNKSQEERSVMREWECGATGAEVGATCDWGAVTGSRGLSTCGAGIATIRGVGTSDLTDHRKNTRRVHSENDMRRNVRRSPELEEEHCSDEFQNFRRNHGWLSPRTPAQHVDDDEDDDDNEIYGDIDNDNAFMSHERSMGSRHRDYNSRCSWNNLIDIVTDTHQQQPHQQPQLQQQQQPQTVALEMAPPLVSSEVSHSTQPYFRRIFGNMVDWLSKLTDVQWSNRKMMKQASKNDVIPDKARNMSDVSLGQVRLSEPSKSMQGMNLSKLKLDNDTPSSKLTGQPNAHLCSFMLGKDSPEPERPCHKNQVRQTELKSCLLATCSKAQKYPSGLKSCLSTNSSKAQLNLAELNSCFSTTCSRILANSPQLEQCPFLQKARSSEQKLATSKRQKNPGAPKPSNSRPELKSSDGQSCYSKSELTTSSSAMEISGSRLDRLQADAADTISQMREPDFALQRKLLKSETLLTKSLTKEFEEIANAPSSCRRTAQLRKLLSELPVENFYVVEWLVTNNIINEANANRFGRLFHVKPHVLEVLTKHRDLLFQDTL